MSDKHQENNLFGDRNNKIISVTRNTSHIQGELSPGRPSGSVGIVCAPCSEAVSSPQWAGVQNQPVSSDPYCQSKATHKAKKKLQSEISREVSCCRKMTVKTRVGERSLEFT